MRCCACLMPCNGMNLTTTSINNTNQLAWIRKREDGLLAVEEVVSWIVEEAGDVVYSHHLQRRVVPYAVQRAKAEMLSVVEV